MSLLPGLARDGSFKDGFVLSDSGCTLVFRTGSRRLLVGDVSLWLNAPVTQARGEWWISQPDIATIVKPLLLQRRDDVTPLRVMLDPGHGGEDSGAVSGDGRLEEKTLALEIAMMAASNLVEQGMAVALTRVDDSFVSLADRIAVTEAWPADVLVSIHLNAAANRLAKGAETFVLPVPGFPSTAELMPEILPLSRDDICSHALSSLLGFSIHRRQPLRRRNESDRGLRRGRFAVLSGVSCPAVLVEGGFLSNVQEAQRLALRETREEIAVAIAEGVMDYARRLPPGAK